MFRSMRGKDLFPLGLEFVSITIIFFYPEAMSIELIISVPLLTLTHNLGVFNLPAQCKCSD